MGPLRGLETMRNEQPLTARSSAEWRTTSVGVAFVTSSSIGTTAHCGLCPVEQCHSIFSIFCHQLSPSYHSQHLKISFYFLFPSFPGSSSSRPFKFLSEDLFGHPILPHLAFVTSYFIYSQRKVVRHPLTKTLVG